MGKANLFIRVTVNQLVSIGGIEDSPTTRGTIAIKTKIVFMHQTERENGKIFVVRKNTPMFVKNLPHIVLMRSIAYQKTTTKAQKLETAALKTAMDYQRTKLDSQVMYLTEQKAALEAVNTATAKHHQAIEDLKKCLEKVEKSRDEQKATI